MKFKLNTGRNLEEAIRSENYLEIPDKLWDCISEIRSILSHEDNIRYGYLLDDLEEDLEAMVNHNMFLPGYEDDIDRMLDDFYDFCDANEILIGLGHRI